MGRFEIKEGNFGDMNLDVLVSKGVIRKEMDTPSSGFTTYTLLRDIYMDTTKTGWEDFLTTTTPAYTWPSPGTPGLWGQPWLAADIEWHWHKHFNITFYNYINLPDGSIFDGNGHTITVDHIQGYNSATGVYEHYLYDTGVTLSIDGTDYNSGNHPGAMQNGIFRIPEFSSTTVQTSKGVIIKNLKMDGTAPTKSHGERFFWNSKFGDYGEDGTSSYGVGAHPSLNIFKYRSEDGFGRTCLLYTSPSQRDS